MTLFCPVPGSPEFKELVSICGGNEAVATLVWQRNNGHHIDKDREGNPSKLFADLMRHSVQNRRTALLLKAAMYNHTNYAKWPDKEPTLAEIYPALYKDMSIALPYLDAVREAKKKFNIKPLYQDREAAENIVSEIRIRDKYNNMAVGVKDVPGGHKITFSNKDTGESMFQQEAAANKVNKELNDKLKAILASIGVRYETVDAIYDKDGNKVNAVGVAKTLDNLIQIVEGKAGEDTLAEETAHMIIEMMGPDHTLVKAMMDTVASYSVYADVVRDYNDIYKGDTNKLKKEAVGKLVAQMIVGEFETQRAENLWERIMRWIASRLGMIKEEQKDAYRELADKILSGNISEELSGEQLADEELYSLEEETVEEEAPSNPYEKQISATKRRIRILESALRNSKEGEPFYESRKKELEELNELLSGETEEGDTEHTAFIKIGNLFLDHIEKNINNLKTSQEQHKELRENLITSAMDVLESWKGIKELGTRIDTLQNELFPISIKWVTDKINDFGTEKTALTWKQITSQNQDISSIKMGTGSLADSPNYIARTIGAIIKSAQNETTAQNAIFGDEINEKLGKLYEWGNANGFKDEAVFDLFIEETKLKSGEATLTLVRPRLDNKPNPKYEIIKNTPALKEFYDYYQEQLAGINNQIPTKVSRYFIPNVAISKFSWNPKTWVKGNTLDYDSFIGREDLFADIVPSGKYSKALAPAQKSKHLAESLLKMKMYANNYENMARILPQVRILQSHIEFEYSGNSEKTNPERSYISASDPKTKYIGKESNLYKQVDKFIEMQVIGKMKEKEGKPISVPIYDENGKQIGENYIHASDIGDQLLKWNSMVRIGLSPVTAVSNWLFGDISNVLEGVGGRFYTVKDLHKATMMFKDQYWKEDSLLTKLLNTINPLQELDDYEQISKVRVKKKWDADDLKTKLYSMQKAGEVFLQTRTMLAVMIKDGYIVDGALTAEGEQLLADPRAIEKLRDKVQRLNDTIHGRYSNRDAAIWSQKIWYRMVFQFRKWIPAAYENRFGKYQWDNRLGADFEGRYVTMARLIKELKKHKGKLASGRELSELEKYNVKKTVTEAVLLIGSTLLFLGLVGGEDDKEWRKDPVVKSLLTLSNRIAGDLEFWYNPKSATNIAKNAVPVAKLIDDTIDMVLSLPHAFYVGDWKYETGSREGQNKFYTKLAKIVPVLKPTGDMIRLFNDNDLEEFR